MILNAIEDNNIDEATVYMWTKRGKCNGECWQKEKMYEQEKSTKTQQTVHKIESFSRNIHEASQFDEFGI